MSESQSRYSIVSGLTTKKLEIITARSQLKTEILKAEQHATNFANEIVDDQKAIMDNAARDVKELDLKLRKEKQKAENLKAREKDQQAMFDEKLKAIELALEKIEGISQSANT